jgi:hypothetical protein
MFIFKSFEITGADGGGSLILIFSKNRRFSDSQNFVQLQNPKPQNPKLTIL